MSLAGGVVDAGSLGLPGMFFKRGYIQQFSVTPFTTGFGAFPTFLKFTFQPNGEVWMGSYI